MKNIRSSIRNIGSATEPTSYDGGWIKLAKIQNNVYRFEENSVFSYLVVGQREAVLIDAGYGLSDYKQLCEEFTSLPVTLINTHGHVDHIGGDRFFSRVYIHQADAGSIQQGPGPGERAWVLGDLQKNPLLPKRFDREQWDYPSITPAKLLQGGEILEFGDDLQLEVIWTPGHTPGSISLLDRERGLLFVGDNFGPEQMWIHLPESNYHDWVESIEKTITLAPYVRTVLSGHGMPREAEVFKELAAAVADIRSGKANAETYPVEDTAFGGTCLKTVFPTFEVLHH